MVLIGRIKKTKGNKGEVALAPASVAPLFLNKKFNAELRSQKYTHTMEIESLHERGGDLLCKISGVETIAAAFRWVGYELYAVAESTAVQTPEEPSLVGYVVSDLQGQAWGTVQWLDEGKNPLLSITSAENGDEILLPFVPAFISTIDHNTRTIVIDPPDGLRDLNS